MPEEKQHNRRWSDHAGAEDIKSLIMHSTSEENRATLLILQQLGESLIKSHESWAALADAFREHQGRFETHLETFEKHAEDEMKLINRGIGFWRAIAILAPTVMSVIGGVGMWSISQHLNVLTRETLVNEAQAGEIAALRGRVDTLNSVVERNTQIINSKIIGLDITKR